MLYKLYDAINAENISIILFFIGVYGLCARRNILKSIISLSLMQAAIILFFVSINHSTDTTVPIGSELASMPAVADPLPQALMITAVVVGVSVTALSLTMFITLYHKYGTTNWGKVHKKREEIH